MLKLKSWWHLRNRQACDDEFLHDGSRFATPLLGKLPTITQRCLSLTASRIAVLYADDRTHGGPITADDWITAADSRWQNRLQTALECSEMGRA